MIYKDVMDIVEDNFCIGCGLCAALCPDSALKMSWNRHGEICVEKGVNCSSCGLCLRVCPFFDNNDNEDRIGYQYFGNIPGIQHRYETGYYLASYAGYSDKNRQFSASGGVVTWILERLLEEGIVDHVICVASTGDPANLFCFQIFSSIDEIRKGSGSAYYPVEMSDVIRYVIEHSGRYAITGLPCFIKAIRLAQNKNAKLLNRITITIGLVCGQQKSSFFTDFAAVNAGVRGRITEVKYRNKSPKHPATNFYFSFRNEKDCMKEIYWKEGIGEAWNNRWFTPNACNYCDDVFAECADVACMDAWLPEYSEDWRGWNFILVRNPICKELLNQNQTIHCLEISVDKIIQSQRNVLSVKRKDLANRLYYQKKKGISLITKRVEKDGVSDFLLHLMISFQELIQKRTRSISIKNNSDLIKLRNSIWKYQFCLSILKDISRMQFFLSMRLFRKRRR